MGSPEAVARQAAEADRLMAGSQVVDQAKPDGEAKTDDRVQMLLENANTKVEQAEHRYNVLQGKYNAEVPTLHKEIKDLKASIQALEGQVAEARTARPAAGGGEKDEEVFGAPMLEMVERRATELVEKRLKELGVKPGAKEPEKLKEPEKPEDLDKPSPELLARYEATLAKLIPEWEKQNEDPKFILWLGQRDPVSGLTRMSILQRHHRALDAFNVAEVFSAFTESREIGSRAQSLDHLVSPPAGEGSADRADSSGKKIWTRADIDAFYRDRKLGRFRTKEEREKAARMEEDIFAAQKEGRVRG